MASLFVKESIEPKACTLKCDPKVVYMTCPSSGLAKLYQVCVNCCTAGEDCKLYGYDESLACTGEPQSYISAS
ncbi:hypothetical protein H5410_017640 [Solanum commersonii]|uniref:Uncharacterized protein n=2 Tax=Solanum TaxID=4107 RepID=A0A9J6A021_SOLCO|nr:hypothetical protein H5410_017640 [Solanum commersonii]